MNVVELHPALECDDLVKALRNIADDLEAGKYETRPNMAVLVLASERSRNGPSGKTTCVAWQTHTLGENFNQFAARGILASALAGWDSGEC